MPVSFSSARRAAACATAAALAGAAACRDLPFQPQDPATVTYAPALGINLSQFTRLPSGVYIRDVAVGSGTQVDSNSTITYSYRVFLANGTPIDTNFASRAAGPAALNSPGLIIGFRTGLLGARQGSRRQLIVPPSQAYGNRTTNDPRLPLLPAGSVLFFDINLLSVTTPPPTTPPAS